MIRLTCPACQKKLTVKDEQAGKRARCPCCSQTVDVPTPAPVAPSSEQARTLGLPTAKLEAGGTTATHSLSDNLGATEGGARPAASPGASLTSFLAPAQSGNELGRLGKYRVLKVLGKGGMGVVFLAEDSHLHRKVALKAVLPELANSDSVGKRFLREAQAMAAVEHDHIVRIYQVDEERRVPFLAMELLKGETLEERLKDERKLSVAEVLRIGREMAEGLKAAHEHDLIHRDIKPANIWLEAPRNRVKILDFGLARPASQDAGITQEGAVLGTPAYMAPEQARSQPVDARTDLFSLGCVLYRMLTGKLAFKGKDIVSTLLAVVSHQPDPPAALDEAVPQELSDLVMRLLEKDPDRRPGSAGEVVEALRALEAKRDRARAGEENTVTLPLRPSRVAGGRSGRLKRLMVAAALIALLLGGVWLAVVLLGVEKAKGVLMVEMDSQTETRIKDGTLVLTGTDGKVCYTIAPRERNKEVDAGYYTIRIVGVDGLVVNPPEITLKKGGKVTVRVTAAPGVVADVPRIPPSPVEMTEVTGTDWLDLLQLPADACEVRPGDPWVKRDGTWITTGVPTAFAQVAFPVIPRGGYDLSAEVSLREGNDCIEFALPVGPRSVVLIFNGFEGTRSGLTRIGEAVLQDDQNPTVVRQFAFTTGKVVKIAVSVRLTGDRAEITATADGVPPIKWAGPLSDLSRPLQVEFRPDRLGFGTWRSRYILHAMKFKRVDGLAEMYQPARPHRPNSGIKRIPGSSDNR